MKEVQKKAVYFQRISNKGITTSSVEVASRPTHSFCSVPFLAVLLLIVYQMQCSTQAMQLLPSLKCLMSLMPQADISFGEIKRGVVEDFNQVSPPLYLK